MMKKALALNIMLLTPMYITPMEENKAVKACKEIAQELSNKEFPLRVNPHFYSTFSKDVYNAPYFCAGIITTSLYLKNGIKYGIPGSLTGLIAKTFAIGLAAKWVAHEVIVNKEIQHDHYGKVFDYTGLFNKPTCKEMDRGDGYGSW